MLKLHNSNQDTDLRRFSSEVFLINFWGEATDFLSEQNDSKEMWTHKEKGSAIANTA